MLKKIVLNGIILVSALNLCAQVTIPKLVSNNMVLQQQTDVKIWGWAQPGENVSVAFLNEMHKTTTDENSEWTITLSDLPAGGPHTMKIEASNTIIIENILIGEVWLNSGQSNMQTTMQRVSPMYPDEIANATNDKIRYFAVPNYFDFNDPQKDLPSGEWQIPDPEKVLGFSAVSYFFACELYHQYKVPIGIINSSLGGSPIQSWVSEETIKKFPEEYEKLLLVKVNAYIDSVKKADNERMGDWYKRSVELDEGYKNTPWSDPIANITDWKKMNIPGFWVDTDLGKKNGVVWFRKDVEIPASMAGKQGRLNLGRIVDADSAFINGKYVGRTTYQYPPRRYDFGENVLHEGINTIVVRITSNMGSGGFDFGKPYNIVVGDETFELTGEWRYKLGVGLEPLQGETFFRWNPVGLYNAMICPLANYQIKGVAWYQGESNTYNPQQYSELLPLMIKDWRELWQNQDLPFLLVQLPNYMAPKDEPGESGWASFRDVQLKALAIPNTAMAITIDIGEENDIHPLNKKDVGKRLCLAAREVAYGEKDIVATGPLYKSMKINGNKIEISFDYVGSGLMAKGDDHLKYVAIAGKDKNFVWANSKIEGDKVIVWNKDVENPIAVRYAWADNPEGCNLYNKEGLPASPFRTDNW